VKTRKKLFEIRSRIHDNAHNRQLDKEETKLTNELAPLHEASREDYLQRSKMNGLKMEIDAHIFFECLKQKAYNSKILAMADEHGGDPL